MDPPSVHRTAWFAAWPPAAFGYLAVATTGVGGKPDASPPTSGAGSLGEDRVLVSA